MLAPESVPGFLPEGEGARDSDEESQLQRPEDAIPDLPENREAREFLKMAPRQGLHMPLGREVKVMQCWRCKAYGHRSGDKECPMRDGNFALDTQRRVREDPMSVFHTNSQAERERQEKYERVEQLRVLVEEIRAEERERKRRKQEKKETKKAARKESREHKKSKKDKKDKH